MAVCQNLVPLVNIKIAGKWMFIPLKIALIGIDPYPHVITITYWCVFRRGFSGMIPVITFVMSSSRQPPATHPFPT